MSNSEMVERVAKAIYETWAVSRGVTEPWDELRRLGHSIVEEARSEARAAIKAMREPTAEMLESCGNGECAKWAPGAWANMIDAALSFAAPPVEAKSEDV